MDFPTSRFSSRTNLFKKDRDKLDLQTPLADTADSEDDLKLDDSQVIWVILMLIHLAPSKYFLVHVIATTTLSTQRTGRTVLRLYYIVKMSSNKVPCQCDNVREDVSKRTERDHRNGPVVRQQKKSTGRKRQRMESSGTVSYRVYSLQASTNMFAGSDGEMDVPMDNDQTSQWREQVCVDSLIALLVT